MTKHYNGLKTALLFGVMWVIILGVGGALAQYVGDYRILPIFMVFGLVSTAMTYWNSDKIAIRSMRAVPVSPEQEPAMYRIVQELSEKAGQPMPRLYVAPTVSPNAFATGRNPQHAAVCCTQGILQLLNERELRGVLAHELMHVYNRDILTSSIASAAAGIITTGAQMSMYANMRDRGRDAGPLGFLMPLLAPMAATMVQLMISRTREYDADEDGSKLSQDPLALASALHKLEVGVDRAPLPQNQSVQNAAHAMIANPFGSRVREAMSTHPPMQDRIARLQQMDAQMGAKGLTIESQYRERKQAEEENYNPYLDNN
ncbi:MAG: zinc metalloprotease HtpX [Micrococcaceae bacterium]